MLLAKLKALHQHLRSANLVAQEKLDSWAENIKLLSATKGRGWGVRLCRCEYTAVFLVEAYSRDPALVLALVAAWLEDNDSSRQQDGLAPADVTIDMMDDNTAELTVEVIFREDIELVEDETGPVTFRGKQWRIADVDISTAEDAEVIASDESTPVPDELLPDNARETETGAIRTAEGDWEGIP